MNMSGYNNPVDYPQKLADMANTPREEVRFNPQMMIPPPSFFGSGQYPNQQMYYPPQFDTYGPANAVFVPQNNTYFSHLEYRQGAGAGGQTQVLRQNSNVASKLGETVMHHLLRDILRDVQRALPAAVGNAVAGNTAAGNTAAGNTAAAHTRGFVEQLQQVMVRPPLSKAPVRPETAGPGANRRSKRRLKYTREQDDLILRLKKDGKLWVEIAEVSGVGSYLAARNRYQVIVGQQGNNNSSSWTAKDRRVLHQVLDNAELDKWRCIAAELSKASGKTFTSKECRDMVRYLFWTNPSSFGISDEVVTECAKEQKITERAVLQENMHEEQGRRQNPLLSPTQVMRYQSQIHQNHQNHQNHQLGQNLNQNLAQPLQANLHPNIQPLQPNLQPNLQQNIQQNIQQNLQQNLQPNLGLAGLTGVTPNLNQPILSQPNLNQPIQNLQPKLVQPLHHPTHPQSQTHPHPPYDFPYDRDDYKLYY